MIADAGTPTIQISTPRNGATGTGLNTVGACPIDLYSDGVAKTFGDDLGPKVSVTLDGSIIRIAHPETAGKIFVRVYLSTLPQLVYQSSLKDFLH